MPRPSRVPRSCRHAVALSLAPLGAIAAPPAFTQGKAPVRVVKLTVAQLWLDVGVHAMPGMPEMPAGMGGLFGKKAEKEEPPAARCPQ